VRIRPARPDEGWLLRDIEIASKAYWRYSDRFMDRFARVVSMSPEFVKKHEVWVLEDDEAQVIGFHGLIHRGKLVLLDHLWLLPGHIGAGHGRRLFEHAGERARAAGGERLEWSAEPHAIGFYEHMGGRYLREETGKLDDRRKIYGLGLEVSPSSP
jgi:GNAT superfamily N-acetyltransferase